MSTGRGDLADNEPPPTGKAGPAKVGPTTAAMRLRPATARKRTEPGVIEQQELEATRAEASPGGALAELLELHTSAGVVPLCRECLTPDPCRTRQLAERIAGTATPPEEGSQ